MFSSKAVSTVKILMSTAIDIAQKREITQMVSRLRELPGCLSFSFTRSKDNHDLWVLNSHWASDESMRNYFFEKDLGDLVQIFAGHCREMRFNNHFCDKENSNVA